MSVSETSTTPGVVLTFLDVPVPELPDEVMLVAWIRRILRQELKTLRYIHFVFVDDNTLLKINQEHLGHDTLTDIITFPYCTEPLEAEIYISIERVRENAGIHHVSVLHEILRVMAHGVLHLCGWNDKTASESMLMRQREDACLALAETPQIVSS